MSTPANPRREALADFPSAGSHAHVLEFLLDNMGEGVTVVDRAGSFVMRNSAAGRIAGITAEHRSHTLGVCLSDGIPFLLTSCPHCARFTRNQWIRRSCLSATVMLHKGIG